MNQDRVVYAVAAGLAAVLLVTVTIAAHPGLRVATGDSMEPTMTAPVVAHCTDVPASDVEVGDIVSVTIGGEDIMHRVESVNGDKLQTAGDGRESSDDWTAASNVNCEVESWWSIDPSAYV